MIHYMIFLMKKKRKHGSKSTLGMSKEDMDQHMLRNAGEEKEAT